MDEPGAVIQSKVSHAACVVWNIVLNVQTRAVHAHREAKNHLTSREALGGDAVAP